MPPNLSGSSCDLRATWKDIILFHTEDSKLGFKLAPKLTEAHIRPNTFQKMKVKFASQVLSHTVPAGCFTYYSSGQGPKTMLSTGELLEFFNNLFDIFNSSSSFSTSIYRKGFRKNESQRQYIPK